jgi:MFS family permease
VTLLMQTASSFLAQSMPVIGPTLTDAAGVRHELIGHLASVASLGTLWFLMGGVALVEASGPVRLLQWAAGLGALGLLAALGGTWPAMLAAALLVGLSYGPAPPAGSELLMRHAPARHRGLIFSVKQSGAPLGAALAGAILPLVAAAWGWRAALAVAAGFSVLALLAVETVRRRIDLREGGPRLALLAPLASPRMLLAPFRPLAATPSLVRIAYVGFALANVQGSVFAIYVTFLVSGLGFGLAEAGGAFAVLQFAGAAARILVGWLADRLGSAVLMLIVVAIGGSAMMGVVAAMTAAWPWPAILLASFATGFLCASWNGVMLAEVARVAPAGRVGEATSSAVFFTFIGYVTGPAAFTTILLRTGSYPAAFLALGALPLTAAAAVLLGRSRPQK